VICLIGGILIWEPGWSARPAATVYLPCAVTVHSALRVRISQSHHLSPNESIR
jgi:hypothetical protein